MDISINKMIYQISKRRRGTFLYLFVDFCIKETTFVYVMKVGKKGIWTEVGFPNVPVISESNEGAYIYQPWAYNRSFKRNQRQLVRVLLNHEDVLKELEKYRLRILVNHGINILKKIEK